MQKTQEINISVSPEDEALAKLVAEDVERGLIYLQEKHADRAILAFKLAFEKSVPGSNLRDVVSQNLLTAYRMRIGEILKEPQVEAVNRYTPEISALVINSELANDKIFRGKFADSMKGLGMDFFQARQHEAALFFIRKAISIEPCPSYYVDLTNAIAWLKTPAQLRDYTTAYTEAEIANHIFITCAPKSGSTFLKNVLVAVTEYKDLFPVYAGLQNEQEIDMPQLVKFGNVNTVTQQHARASEANIQLMQAFGIFPVILVRNIFDTVLSLLDFYTKGFTHSTFFPKQDFLAFDEATKIDLLIEYAIPWYFQFVAGWQRAEKEQRLDVYWLTYEEMIADKPATIESVLDFYGLSAPRELVVGKISESESNNDSNRFNKGIAGRGRTGLSEIQKEKIRHLAQFFPSADFSLLGI